ncbi:hypothetical protein L7F22_059922 [Adiantum nelumboides]|nr:hypothetical protein [Adiantum nelumboides]
MADSVYYHLERMLPELDDLKERRLFSDAEVKEIARRRREFEFRLERRSKMKEDYLSYIEYELQVEKLRLLRKKSLVRELHSFRRRWQPSLCDRASAMRIMLIYQLAVTRFKGDLDLWMQYLEYCKCRGTRRKQKVLINTSSVLHQYGYCVMPMNADSLLKSEGQIEVRVFG